MLDKIAAHYKDELSDVATYAAMAGEATDDTQRCILRDIAREESKHAKYLRHLLEKAGKYAPTEELKKLEDAAEAALRTF